MSGPVDVLAAELRRMCGHDSRSVDGCVTCEAADRLEQREAAVAELIAFVENIAESCSEPLNSAVGYRDKESRRKFMGVLRASARQLLARVGGAA